MEIINLSLVRRKEPDDHASSAFRQGGLRTMSNGISETSALHYHFDSYVYAPLGWPSQPIQFRHEPHETFPGANPIAQTRIIDQLNRILASAAFAKSSRLQRFLRFVVTETLASREERLKEYTIALDVFERDDSFDPQTNSIVRVEASRLRGKLALYNATDGRDDPVLISLPTGAYIPVFRPNENSAAV